MMDHHDTNLPEEEEYEDKSLLVSTVEKALEIIFSKNERGR